MAVKGNNRSKTRKALDIVVIILVLFAICIDALYIYYKYFNQDITIGVTYLSDQTAINASKLTEEEIADYELRCIMEANLYSNAKGNGIELQELQLNYFTDWTLTKESYRSSGMQYIGDVSSEDFTLEGGHAFGIQSMPVDTSIVSTRFTYYDTTLGLNWSGTSNSTSVATKFNRDEVFVVSVGGEPYAIQLNKKKDSTASIGFIEISKYTQYRNYGELFQLVMQAIKSNSKGYGDYYITLDVSDFFTIRKYDKETGKFLSDDVTDVLKNYAVLKFHYDSNGAKTAKQSLFGSINCNNTYGMTEEEKSTEYWQERILYNLTERDMQVRYSELCNGNLLSLSTGTKSKLSNAKRIKVNIVITLTPSNNISGLDYNALKGLEINTLTINGSGKFRLCSGALVDTNIKEIRHASTVQLELEENATNSEYLEVVL